MAGFGGGIHPWYFKELTEKKPIEKERLPKKVFIPMSQHIGAPAKPIVKVGDEVKAGQLIGEAQAGCSSNIHSSVSGKVVGLESYPHPGGGEATTAIIETSENQESVILKKLSDPNQKEIIDRIKEAGIVGMGGAAFPTHIKYNIPEGKKAEYIILNGAECEPYLTADHRLMVEYPKEIIEGLKLLMKAANVKHAYIGVEDNKKDAIAAMKKFEQKNIQIVKLHTKYPQGGEKMLIYVITKRKVPTGGLPIDVGVIVNNVGTAYAVYDAMQGNPLTRRVVTVTGDVKEPKNVWAYVGTTFKDLVIQADDYIDEPGQILNGGPMMGLAQSTDEVPVLKGTSGILVKQKKLVKVEDEQNCIRCSRCIDSCPMMLLPTTIALHAKKGNYDMSEKNFVTDCIECGCCSFVCPSKIPLVQYFKLAKAHITLKRKKCQKK